ncbi:sulfurtransferase TusA family protein [Streptomyces tendae]|nr:hypothetical protein [Streptomyces tendae]
MRGAPPGTVVHVVATDPAAPLDLPARTHPGTRFGGGRSSPRNR